MALRRVLLAGILAGLIAGLGVTGRQSYESAAPHQHEDATSAAWESADGVERPGFTLLANIAAASGFGLLLAAGFV